MRVIAFFLLIVVAVLVVLERKFADSRQALRIAVRAATVIVAALSLVWIVQVGHNGAKAVWESIPLTSSACSAAT